MHSVVLMKSRIFASFAFIRCSYTYLVVYFLDFFIDQLSHVMEMVRAELIRQNNGLGLVEISEDDEVSLRPSKNTGFYKILWFYGLVEGRDICSGGFVALFDRF